MLTSGSHDQYNHHKNMKKMKENVNLLSKQLSRESVNEQSFRVLYYGKSSGSVPFMWESRPGTPKNDSMRPSSLTNFPPPLTPPPSYLTPDTSKTPKTPIINTKSSQKKPSKGVDSFVISNIFPRRIKTLVSPSFSSSSKSSTSSIDSISSPSSMRLIEHFELEDDIYKSPTSTLCFGFNKQGFLKDVCNRRARANFKFSL